MQGYIEIFIPYSTFNFLPNLCLNFNYDKKGSEFQLMTSHFNIPGFQRQRNPSSLPVKKASFFWSKMAARTIVFRTDLSEKSAKGFNFCFFEVSTRRQGRVGQAEPARTKSCWCKWITSKKFVNIWKCFQYNYVNFAIKCQITSVEKTLFFLPVLFSGRSDIQRCKSIPTLYAACPVTHLHVSNWILDLKENHTSLIHCGRTVVIFLLFDWWRFNFLSNI